MSEHCGYVVEVKELRPHSNADRLQIATFFGNDTIVGLDTKIGDVGVYFPVDLQLSIEFCAKNDLVRRKDENGNSVGGYLDPDKRNIRALKLRGEKSDGLFMPISAFDYLYKDGAVNHLSVGDTVDTLNGCEICRKYIPHRRSHQMSQSDCRARKPKVSIAPLFQEHVDTEQLVYNMNAFKAGDQIEITLKMHGCFTSETKVRMADGSLKKIKDITVGEQVLGYDFNKKEFAPATVLNCFHNDKSKNWRKIKISREGLCGDKRGYITCTHNHPFWWEEQNKWIKAEALIPGMEISTLAPAYILSSRQKEILLGMILGDGYYATFHNNRTAEIQNSSKKYAYLEYLKTILGDLYQIEKRSYISGYGTTVYRGRTCRSGDIANYFNQFFSKNDNNKLTEKIIDAFTPLSAAIFYMDDGSLAYSDKQEDRALLAICDYNEHDSKIIQKCFKKFGIDTVYYKDSSGYSRLRFNKDAANRLFKIISPYMPNFMRYKLPNDYTNNFIQLKACNGYNGYVFYKQQVLDNIPVKSTHYEFDLETSLHNYVVGYSLVHNTSGRTAYLPKLVGYHRSIWDRITKKPGKPIYDWGYVTGTRRVVIDDFGAEGGYYGDNKFREQHAKIFEGKLHKGETVYYEVVGFTDNGTPIMPPANNKKIQDKDFVKKYGDTTTFAYGCAPNGEDNKPQSDMYVYRMTLTTEDGDIVEYTPDFMRYRCEQMGVKSVPVMWKGYIPNVANDKGLVQSEDFLTNDVGEFSEWIFKTPGEYIKDIAEQFYDGPDPIGKTHVREGVVIRIVNRPKFTAYKHKNFYFKCLSGIAVELATENGTINEMDEDRLAEL